MVAEKVVSRHNLIFHPVFYMGASIQSIASGKSLCIEAIFVSHQSKEKLFEEKNRPLGFSSYPMIGLG